MIPNKEWDDEVSSSILENHFPHGASAKTLTHLGIMMKYGSENGLAYFDWHDPQLNKELYGSDQVPSIDFYKNPVPMVIYAGVQDKIVNIEDVRSIKENMQNIRYYKEIDGDHLSFFIGKDMSYVDDMID